MVVLVAVLVVVVARDIAFVVVVVVAVVVVTAAAVAVASQQCPIFTYNGKTIGQSMDEQSVKRGLTRGVIRRGGVGSGGERTADAVSGIQCNLVRCILVVVVVPGNIDDRVG